MRNNVIEFKAGSPFSDGLELLHTKQTRAWYDKLCALSNLTGLPMQTVMENWDELADYVKEFGHCYLKLHEQ